MFYKLLAGVPIFYIKSEQKDLENFCLLCTKRPCCLDAHNFGISEIVQKFVAIQENNVNYNEPRKSAVRCCAVAHPFAGDCFLLRTDNRVGNYCGFIYSECKTKEHSFLLVS